MTTVEDLIVERQIAELEDVARVCTWSFERVGSRRFRVLLCAKNGDVYQIEVMGWTPQ